MRRGDWVKHGGYVCSTYTYGELGSFSTFFSISVATHGTVCDVRVTCHTNLQ